MDYNVPVFHSYHFELKHIIRVIAFRAHLSGEIAAREDGVASNQLCNFVRRKGRSENNVILVMYIFWIEFHCQASQFRKSNR